VRVPPEIDRDVGFPYDEAMERRPKGLGAGDEGEPAGEGTSFVAVCGYEENRKEVSP
jgi:hypothetical protein